MFRINSSGATIDGQFKQSPAPATQVSAAWLNALQAEICRVIEDEAGGDAALDPGDNGQLLAAIVAVAERVSASAGRKKGRYVGSINAGGLVRIDFAEPFDIGVDYVLSLTPLNSAGSSSRDNFLQRRDTLSDPTGFYVVVQGAHTGGDNTLDGFDWIAEAV
jgi:hypothetical protein